MKKPDLFRPADAHYSLNQALLVYKAPRGETYLTLHRAGALNGRATLGPGQPATQALLRGLADACGAAGGLAGWIAPTLLFIAPGTIAWWRPPQPATLFFSHQKGGAKNFSDRAPQPGLVFLVREKKWFVWALAGNVRPTPTTALYHAPHFNVWADGRICVGNVELPKQLTPDMAAAYERAYFDSRFTHPNHPHTCTGDAVELWRGLIADFGGPFPVARLVPAGKTLHDAVTDAARTTHTGGFDDDED